MFSPNNLDFFLFPHDIFSETHTFFLILNIFLLRNLMFYYLDKFYLHFPEAIFTVFLNSDIYTVLSNNKYLNNDWLMENKPY